MTTLFHDIKQDGNSKDELTKHRIHHTLFDEFRYADDTIIFSENTNTLHRYIRSIEEKGAMVGLTLNKSECEALNTGGELKIFFETGNAVTPVSYTKHLGCMLNDSANVQIKITKNNSEVFETYKKLDPCCKNRSI